MQNHIMPNTKKTLRVLIVDDNRDGADALGLVMEALGHQIHVTYGGTQALDVAAAFRPDLILVDLLMPGMNGCELVVKLRQNSILTNVAIVAITGLKDEGHKTLAIKAGCNSILTKPVALAEIKAMVDKIVPIARPPKPIGKTIVPPDSNGNRQRLSIEDARRIRGERPSKRLTQAECEAAICDGVQSFQEEYLGWRAEQLRAHLVKDMLVVRILGVLTLAERQLSKSSLPDQGRDLIKKTRNQLLEIARPMLNSLVHEVVGEKVTSMHHDISTVTGEEVIVFSLSGTPALE